MSITRTLPGRLAASLTFLLCLLAVVVPSAPAAKAGGQPDLAALEEQVRQKINAIRKEHGLPTLAADKLLARVARGHSRRMAEENFFSHDDPAGRSLVDRLQEAKIAYRAAGENIFRSTNVADPVQAAVDGWMKSPGHRANILHPAFGQTGVGIWRVGNAFYFTQVFLGPPGSSDP